MNGFTKRFGKGKTLDKVGGGYDPDRKKLKELRCFFSCDKSLSEDTRKNLFDLLFIMDFMQEDLERCKNKCEFLHRSYIWVLIINFFMCLFMAFHVAG